MSVEKNIHRVCKLLVILLPKKSWRKKVRLILEYYVNVALSTEKGIYSKKCKKIIAENKAFPKDSYHVVSVGRNCFSRIFTTLWGFKRRKAEGELSMPFDLSVHPLTAVCQILSNDFADYLDKAEYNGEHWINPFYKISYIHDTCSDREEFAERYQNRIANLRAVLADEKPVLFVLHLNFENVQDEILQQQRGAKPFKLLVLGYDCGEVTANSNVAVCCQKLPFKGYPYMEDRLKYAQQGFELEKPLMDLVSESVKNLLS